MAERSDPECGGFHVTFLDTSQLERECPICRLAFRDPVQTSCGHRFCKTCMEKVIRVHSRCPLDNTIIPRNQELFQDNAFLKETLNPSRIKCSNGCEWIGNYQYFVNNDHFSKCGFAVTKCPNEDCNETFLRHFLEQHKSECPWEKNKCIYCGDDVTRKDKQSHEENCIQFPVQCKKCLCKEIPRQMLKEHIDNECVKTKITCPYLPSGCVFIVERDMMEAHVKEQNNKHLLLVQEKSTHNYQQIAQNHQQFVETHKNEISKLKQIAQDHQQIVETHKKEITQAREEIVKLKQERDEQQKQLTQVHQQITQDHKQIVETHNKEITQAREEIVKLKHEKDEQQKQIVQLKWNLTSWKECRESFANFWKIPGITDKLKTEQALLSDEFYTEPGGSGYRFRLQFSSRDCTQGEATQSNPFILLHFFLCIGDHDDALTWPFKHEVTLTIVNQSGKPDEQYTIKPEETPEARLKDCFSKPVESKYNLAAGAPMISHKELITGGFIRNDQLLIKCQVKLAY